MSLFKKIRFAHVWFGAALAAIVVYFFFSGRSDCPGLVESRLHRLGPQEAGRIHRVLVAVGEEVRSGQLLAQIDAQDLVAGESWVREEIERLEAALRADRQRYALEYDRLRLQRNTDAIDVHAQIAGKRAELEALNREIARLSAAEQAGLGRPRDLSDLEIRRDEVARWIEEGEAVLRTGSSRGSKDGGRAPGTDADSVVLSMMGERMDRLSELRLRLEEVQGSLGRRGITAPCDGRIVEIAYAPGDVVPAFAAVLTLAEVQAEFVDAVVPERFGIAPQLGQRVAVHRNRAGGRTTRGTIESFDPGVSQAPPRLTLRGLPVWGRKFRVKLDEGHRLLPGEAVQVELLRERVPFPEARAAARPSGASEATPRSGSAPDGAAPVYPASALAELQVSDAVWEASRVEPSGIVWLEDLDRYAIVSDDTGRAPSDHQPWIFLMDREGRLEAQPLVIQGAGRLNDVESIAADASGALYLVSSQSVSRTARRPASRQQVLKVRRSGRELRVDAAADFLEVLARSYGEAQLRALGLGEKDGDGRLVLEIEGAVWLDGALILGLKQPRPARGALLWRLRDPDAFLAKRALEPDQLAVYGYADLRAAGGLPAGVSDLAVDASGRIHALATLPGAPPGAEASALARLEPGENGTIAVVPLASFPDRKAEGLCVDGAGRMAVVFDTDDVRPLAWLTLESAAR